MEYALRLAARKKEFGRVFPPLTQTEYSSETTIPAPMGWTYFRKYQPVPSGRTDTTLLPGELRNANLLRRFEY